MSSRKSVLFGTDPGCDVRVDDQYVSNRHARVYEDGDGRVWVEDLGSTNGTYVQRGSARWKVVLRSDLRPGDVLWLGARTSIPWSSG
jgi:pSer/pThr/pTyr-binding forkhead associated (FHA) protein